MTTGDKIKPHASANPNHFFEAFELCLKNKFSDIQAMVMANGFEKQGKQDASSGCMHYVLRYKAKLSDETV